MTDLATDLRNIATEARPAADNEFAAKLREMYERAKPVIERWIDNTRELNRLFLSAWDAGILDELWKSIRPPGFYLHYFIRARGSGDIKFGKTNNIQRRFETIFTGCSRGCDLIACYPDLPEHESEIKIELRDSRLCGEWLQPDADVLRFLKSIGSNVDCFIDVPAPSFARGGPIRLRVPLRRRRRSSPRQPSGNPGELRSAPEKPADAIEPAPITANHNPEKTPSDARLSIPNDGSIPVFLQRVQ